MLFSSTTFIYLFLPTVLFFNYVIFRRIPVRIMGACAMTDLIAGYVNERLDEYLKIMAAGS